MGAGKFFGAGVLMALTFGAGLAFEMHRHEPSDALLKAETTPKPASPVTSAPSHEHAEHALLARAVARPGLARAIAAQGTFEAEDDETDDEPWGPVDVESEDLKRWAAQPDEVERSQGLHAHLDQRIDEIGVSGEIKRLSCRGGLCRIELTLNELGDARALEAELGGPKARKWMKMDSRPDGTHFDLLIAQLGDQE